MPRRPKPSGRGYRSRRVNVREPIQRFLIVCEGEKTEPAYFDGFRVPGMVINIVGLGKDPISLIERAVYERRNGDYDQAWCVFDRDDMPAERFNRALELAERSGINVAYSIQAFEIWYLLHFDYCDVAMARAEYGARLSQRMGRRYTKGDTEMFQLLSSRQPDAIRNAENLLAQHEVSNSPSNDPSTTVHELVKELNRFVRR